MAEAIPLPFDTPLRGYSGRTVIRVQAETAEFAALFQISVLHVDRGGSLHPTKTKPEPEPEPAPAPSIPSAPYLPGMALSACGHAPLEP